MTDLIIRGGRLIDASGERTGDLGVSAGRIVDADQVASSARVVDASGCVVSTGLVDLLTAIGEPGDEAAETMASAGRAAVRGGYTTVLASPTTLPPVDTAAVVEHVRALADDALCRVEIAGTVTNGAAGERLAPLGELADAGVRWVTDCGTGIQNPRLLRRALEYARPLGLVIAQRAHCDELAGDAHMHEGVWSSTLGLAGTPAEAEEITVMRDLSIARLAGGRLHFHRLSTAGSVAIMAAARSGLPITADAAVIHLSMVDADLATYDANRKVEPPLRPPSDRAAVRAAMVDGALDVIVSAHTPQTRDRKEQPFDLAAAGTVSLETALAVALTAGMPVEALLRAMSWRPAELLGLGAPADRSLASGAPADLVVIDPAETWEVDVASMGTTGANSAWQGLELTGRVRATIVGGVLTHDLMEVPA